MPFLWIVLAAKPPARSTIFLLWGRLQPPPDPHAGKRYLPQWDDYLSASSLFLPGTCTVKLLDFLFGQGYFHCAKSLLELFRAVCSNNWAGNRGPAEKPC